MCHTRNLRLRDVCSSRLCYVLYCLFVCFMYCFVMMICVCGQLLKQVQQHKVKCLQCLVHTPFTFTKTQYSFIQTRYIITVQYKTISLSLHGLLVRTIIQGDGFTQVQTLFTKVTRLDITFKLRSLCYPASNF